MTYDEFIILLAYARHSTVEGIPATATIVQWVYDNNSNMFQAASLIKFFSNMQNYATHSAYPKVAGAEFLVMLKQNDYATLKDMLTKEFPQQTQEQVVANVVLAVNSKDIPEHSVINVVPEYMSGVNRKQGCGISPLSFSYDGHGPGPGPGKAF